MKEFIINALAIFGGISLITDIVVAYFCMKHASHIEDGEL